MVEIVSGLRAGLSLASGEVLGFKDLVGGAQQGRNGQEVAVNIASGQLVVQDQDDLLVARGQDAPVLRTYNSNGSLADHNADGWASGIGMLVLSGVVNTAGSTIQRVDADGAAALYTFDAGRIAYVTTEGGGAYDTIAYVSANAQYEWRDGASGATQRYEGSGAMRLVSSRDQGGNAAAYAYGANGFLSAVTTANGESVYYDYSGNNLSQVRTVAAGVTTTHVHYGYDASNRLTSVVVDLTPADNSTSDGKVYQTSYAYEGSSKRIASITQTDGTQVAFTYVDAGGGNYKVASVRDALNQTTSFTYGTRFTTVTDPLGLVTRYDYDASAQVSAITGPAVAGASAVRQFAYDAAGNVVMVTDGEVKATSFQYDGNGNQVLQRDAAGDTTSRSFDGRNQMLSQTTYTVADPDGAGPALPSGALTDRWVYEAGSRNLLRFSVSAAGNVTEYRYDGFGERVATVTYAGTLYPVQGLAPQAALAESTVAAWAAQQDPTLTQRVDVAYDARGQVQTRTSYARVASDGSGIADGSQSVERYVYSAAGQLLQAVAATGASTTFTYDAAGQLTTIQDWANSQLTTYVYDLAGRKVRERVVQGGITYQDNNMAYDARGNLRDVADARVHVVMDYDAVGNRTHVGTYVDYQGNAGEAAAGSERYYRYDAMNRQVVIDGVDGAGNLGAQGHSVTYDRNGNRTSDTSWGPKVVSATGAVITGYNEDGSAIYGVGATGFAAATGYSTEAYKYDALNRLWSVEKDGVQIDLRYYDGADRVMQSGPGGTLPQQYADLMNQGLAPDQMNGKEGRINWYDANGRLLHQRVLKSDNSAKLDISWDPGENVQGYVADGYDAAGNVVGYTVTNHEAGVINEYTLTTGRFEGYQGAVTHGVSTKQLPGDSTQQYDVNGFLVGVVDSSQGANNRTLVNDSAGHALYVNQGSNIQRQLVVNGEVLGTYGVGVDANNPASGANNNPNFANVVDFNFGYARVSASYPAASPGAYTVRAGDTLQSIARAAYGDSSLWFRIADANGLASSSDLKVGQTLNIPNRVGTISNNADTFKPYDPSKIEGDKTPSLATPVPQKKHNWFAQLIQVVIAVVVAIFAPELLGITSSFWAGVVGGALGSAAGQLAGMAMGTQSSFDWKGVALGAIGGGVASGFYGTAPLGGAVSSPANVVARAVMADALTQGIGVVTGLQQSFDWRSVAGAAAGAVAGAGFDPGVPGSEYAVRYDDEGDLMPGAGPRDGTRFYSSEATSSMSFRAARSLNTVMSTAARRLASAVGRGGRLGLDEIAADAFGNALGQGLVDQQSQLSSQSSPAPGQVGSGTFFVPEIDDATAPRLFAPVKPETIMQMNTIKDWDPTDAQGDLSPVDASNRLIADNGVPKPPSKPVLGATGDAFIENVNATMRETRGGLSRVSVYRDFAVIGQFAELDRTSQRNVLGAMYSYAEALNQGSMFGAGIDARTADVAVRYAEDAARASGALPDGFPLLGSDRRANATIFVTLGMTGAGRTSIGRPSLQSPTQAPAVSGETQATAVGKAYHARRAAERRQSGEFDMVNEPFVHANGQAVMVTRRVNLTTGEPLPETGYQKAQPDAVLRPVIVDDKPLGRPLSKDQQEIMRFIRAYENSFGAPPQTIAIERYDRVTGRPVVTELFKPSDFPLKGK